ncbi:Uncharacterized protein ImpC, partial [hydrothermal vent metagenome]
FHPDALYENLDSFEHLKQLRRRLNNTNTFADAAAEIQSWYPTDDSVSSNTEATINNQISEHLPASNTVPDNLLDSILNTQKNTLTSHSQPTQIDQLIRSIVAPYIEPKADPRQDEMLAMVESALQMHMRNILHHPDFQTLESAWQSIYFLIKRIETGSKLKIFLLDISKNELQSDLAIEEISKSRIYKLFYDTALGDSPWSVLVGNYNFKDTISDIALLENIGTVAKQIGAPFLSAADETLAGCESFDQTPDYSDWNYHTNIDAKNAWQALRHSTVAPYIGLALPRFLLRLPYGKKSDPVDAFKFEEMSENNSHNHYLWGNAAFLKLECLARNFNQHGWQMQLGEVFQTDNLPIHYYTDEGEIIGKPIAEIMLTEKGGEILRENGLTPIWSVRNQDYIRSTDYLSISEPVQNIAGRWH